MPPLTSLSLLADFTRRYTLGGRKRGFARLVAWISMLGMVLGVASLITVMSVMNGFAKELESRVLSLIPHVTLKPRHGVLNDWQSMLPQITAQVSPSGIAPFVDDQVLMAAWGRQRGIRLTGIDVQAQRSVNQLHAHIVDGNVESLSQTPFTVALGAGLARLLGVTVGDEVVVTLPTLSITPLGVFPRTKRLHVVALFRVGADLDSRQAYVSLESAQRLFARAGVDGIQLRFNALPQADTSVNRLREALDGEWQITDWRSTQGSLFTAVRMEKFTVAILLLAVIAVAAFNIVSTLTMAVTEKRRDIAMLGVMGMSSGRILTMFLAQGLLLGGAGIVVGVITGVVLALNISDIVIWFEHLAGKPLFDPRVYYIGRLPSVLEWGDVVITGALALFLSLLATAYPAWRAARIHPVEVLNHG